MAGDRFTLEEALDANRPGEWHPERRRGRPTRYSPELATAVCQLMAEDRNLSAACDELMVNRTTVYSWLRRVGEFRAFYTGTRVLMRIRAERSGSSSTTRRGRPRIVEQLNPRISSVGRPSVYRPQLAHLVQPTNRGTARAVGVTERTIETWRSRYSDFDRAVRLARLGKELPDIQERADRLLERGRRAGLLD